MKTKEEREELVKIKNKIYEHFGSSDWLDLAYIIDCKDIINKHPRLLRSLDFNDDDYEDNILDVLEEIIKKDPNNFLEIKKFLDERFVRQIPKYDEINFSAQVFKKPEKQQNNKLVSVMFPFEFQKTFEAIKNACNDLCLECTKADDIWRNTTIIQDIFELIYTSKIVVADFTGKNPNVFYEVGIAHTLGKTVIPITQSIDHIPSDLRHHKALLYHQNEQGYIELTKNIKKRFEEI